MPAPSDACPETTPGQSVPEILAAIASRTTNRTLQWHAQQSRCQLALNALMCWHPSPSVDRTPSCLGRPYSHADLPPLQPLVEERKGVADVLALVLGDLIAGLGVSWPVDGTDSIWRRSLSQCRYHWQPQPSHPAHSSDQTPRESVCQLSIDRACMPACPVHSPVSWH